MMRTALGHRLGLVTEQRLDDLEVLMNVAFEAKKWITAHTLKALSRFMGKPLALRWPFPTCAITVRLLHR
jgi:hypothetical protein